MIDVVLKAGGTKPSDDLNHTNEELFLSFAAVFGVTLNAKVHRKAIFNYVQTVKTSKSESNLQGQLERSEFWDCPERAYYSLNQKGFDKLISEFGINQYEIRTYPIVMFSVSIGNELISVESFPDERGYNIYQNKRLVDAISVYDFLTTKGIRLPGLSTSKPREIFSWLLKENYEWEIVNYDKIMSSIQN